MQRRKDGLNDWRIVWSEYTVCGLHSMYLPLSIYVYPTSHRKRMKKGTKIEQLVQGQCFHWCSHPTRYWKFARLKRTRMGWLEFCHFFLGFEFEVLRIHLVLCIVTWRGHSSLQPHAEWHRLRPELVVACCLTWNNGFFITFFYVGILGCRSRPSVLRVSFVVGQILGWSQGRDMGGGWVRHMNKLNRLWWFHVSQRNLWFYFSIVLPPTNNSLIPFLGIGRIFGCLCFKFAWHFSCFAFISHLHHLKHVCAFGSCCPLLLHDFIICSIHDAHTQMYITYIIYTLCFSGLQNLNSASQVIACVGICSNWISFVVSFPDFFGRNLSSKGCDGGVWCLPWIHREKRRLALFTRRRALHPQRCHQVWRCVRNEQKNGNSSCKPLQAP